MADTPTPTPTPSLEELQHWTWVLGRAQQMMLEHGFDAFANLPAPTLDPTAALRASAGFWSDTMQLWQRFL